MEVRIGPLIKDCATFSSCMSPIVVGYLRFPIQHPPPLIDYSLKHFEPCVVSRLKLLHDNLELSDFLCHNTKHKSSLRSRSFFFCNSFLKLEESICIDSSIDALVGIYFHGIMASVLYSLCIKRCSC